MNTVINTEDFINNIPFNIRNRDDIYMGGKVEPNTIYYSKYADVEKIYIVRDFDFIKSSGYIHVNRNTKSNHHIIPPNTWIPATLAMFSSFEKQNSMDMLETLTILDSETRFRIFSSKIYFPWSCGKSLIAREGFITTV